MMRRVFPYLWCVVLLATACSARTPIIQDTPTISAPVSPSPTAKKPRARVPAVVKAVSVVDETLWVYDPKANSVSEVATGEGLRMPRFINENEVAFVQGDRPAFVRVIDLRTKAVRELFHVETGVAAYGLSPDVSTAAYITVDDDSYPHLHMRPLAGVSPVLTAATLARAEGRERLPDDQSLIEFSSDGQLVLVVYTPADGRGARESLEASQLQIRGADGALIHASPMSREPTMAAWAPDGTRAYYRTEGGALTWLRSSNGTQRLFSRPRWFNPSVAPDGRSVAFDTGGPAGGTRVRVMNTRSGRIATIFKAGRFNPIFVSRTEVWAQEARACTDADCLTPGLPVNRVYAWDLEKGKERALAIESLVDADVWFR